MHLGWMLRFLLKIRVLARLTDTGTERAKLCRHIFFCFGGQDPEAHTLMLNSDFHWHVDSLIYFGY